MAPRLSNGLRPFLVQIPASRLPRIARDRSGEASRAVYGRIRAVVVGLLKGRPPSVYSEFGFGSG